MTNASLKSLAGFLFVSLFLLFQGCSGQSNLTNLITVNPTLSSASVFQGGTTSLTFTAQQPLSQNTTITFSAPSLILQASQQTSCTIPAGSKTCTISTIHINSSENPVAHRLTFSASNPLVAFDPTFLTLTVKGVLALTLTDPTDGINQGPSAEDITVTNVNTDTSAPPVAIDNVFVGDSTSAAQHPTAATPAAAFEIYKGTRYGNWCASGCEDTTTSPVTNCWKVDAQGHGSWRQLASGASCRLYIRATQATGTAIGVPVDTYLNVVGSFGNPTRIPIKNTPILYAGGNFTTAGGVTVNRIASWDGSNWSPLGSGVGGGGSILSLTSDALGDLYVGGDNLDEVGGITVNGVAKWDGSNWIDIDSSVLGEQFKFAPAIATSSRSSDVYLLGPPVPSGGFNGIASWNGSAWLSLGTGLNVSPNLGALTTDASGKMLYVGANNLNTAGGVAVNGIAQWGDIGTANPSWLALGDIDGNGVRQSGSQGEVYALATDVNQDKLYVGGFFDTAGTTNTPVSNVGNIAQWDIANKSWSPLGEGVSGPRAQIFALAIAYNHNTTADSAQYVYAGGLFTTAGTSVASNIARWSTADNPNHSNQWSALDSGTNDGVLALIVDGANNLYVGGLFTTAGGQTVNYIAKWDGSWSPLTSSAGVVGVGGASGSNRVAAFTILNRYSDTLSS
ncbi:MAG: hypothetical protein AAGA27_01525 [Pseudomonadota bacterium]